MTPSSDRIGSVDVARGMALAGMVVFHTAWDLHAFGLVQIDPASSLVWEIFGDAVASVFLFLSGFGLVLARLGGRGDTKRALKRLGVIAAAAALVTAATAWATPGQTVRFGILHCIAVCNLIALPLLQAPVAWAAAIAVGALMAPWLVPEGSASLWWLGLSDRIPATLDYRPVLPWLGVVLLGVVFGRCGGAGFTSRIGSPASRTARSLAAAGRHSLALYLVHQPLLFGGLALLTAGLHRPEAVMFDATFLSRCTEACAVRATADSCQAMCECAQGRLATLGFSPSDQPGLRAAILSCMPEHKGDASKH